MSREKDLACGICGKKTVRACKSREMMLGLRTEFIYLRCIGCGCLWLADPPADYAPYYPNQYYSFAPTSRAFSERLKSFFRTKRDMSYFGRSVFGAYLARYFEECALRSVSALALGRNERILDVGCGNGRLLHTMAAVGFTELTGIDRFVEDGAEGRHGVRLLKCSLDDMKDGEYDLIMFHHSLEHVEDPKATLRAADRLLAKHGICLIRLPLIASAWWTYGPDWVQLDAPRHSWIPTVKGMQILAESAGLTISRLEYDSTAFQFWGSELYIRNIALNEVRNGSARLPFRHAEMNGWRTRAKELNHCNRGDQAAFYLTRTEGSVTRRVC